MTDQRTEMMPLGHGLAAVLVLREPTGPGPDRRPWPGPPDRSSAELRRRARARSAAAHPVIRP